MPRYVIERNFGTISDDDMLAASALWDELISARFQEIVWEHSHIVATDDGEIVTFCIYAAPSEEMIREHAEAFGSHSITNLYELVDDVTPTEVRAPNMTRTPPDRNRAMIDEVLEKVSAIPGVESVATSSRAPFEAVNVNALYLRTAEGRLSRPEPPIRCSRPFVRPFTLRR